MNFTTRTKTAINQVLRHLNLRVDTCTAESAELKRLKALKRRGYFDQKLFPVDRAFSNLIDDQIFTGIKEYRVELNKLERESDNDVGYTYDNEYYASPDAEVLYTFIRKFEPEQFVEVGSGNSTRIARQAIKDGKLNTRIISIDPNPRRDIEAYADDVVLESLEGCVFADKFPRITSNDILFIDASHSITCGNDTIFLYLKILPTLMPGTLIHIHDVFLPYEYPWEWIGENRWAWNEQYLVQVMINSGTDYRVLWPGYDLQKRMPDFSNHFPHLKDKPATSFWIKKVN